MTHETEDTKSQALVTLPEQPSLRQMLEDPKHERVRQLAEDVTKLVRSTVLPLADTPEHREEIKSFARKIQKTRTTFENMGKAIADEVKDIPNRVDKGRRLFKTTMEGLEDDVLAPVKAWQTREDARIREHTNRIERIRTYGSQAATFGKTAAQLRELLAIASAEPPENQDEFAEEYDVALRATNGILLAAIAEAERVEKEREELAKLRAEKEAQEAQKAAQEAEEKRKADLAAAEELGRQKAALEARQAAEQAERERAAKEAADKAAAEAARREEERRAANKAHQGKINREIAAKIAEVISSIAYDNREDIAKAIVTAIAKGEIPRVAIDYR